MDPLDPHTPAKAQTASSSSLTHAHPRPGSPETILTTGELSWRSTGTELVFIGSSRPITPLLSCGRRHTHTQMSH